MWKDKVLSDIVMGTFFMTINVTARPSYYGTKLQMWRTAAGYPRQVIEAEFQIGHFQDQMTSTHRNKESPRKLPLRFVQPIQW